MGYMGAGMAAGCGKGLLLITRNAERHWNVRRMAMVMKTMAV